MAEHPFATCEAPPAGQLKDGQRHFSEHCCSQRVAAAAGRASRLIFTIIVFSTVFSFVSKQMLPKW